MYVHEIGKMEYFVWFDRNGEPYGDTRHWEIKSTLSITPDRELPMNFSYTWRCTWLSDEQTLCQTSGAIAMVTVPGHGVVFGELGRQVLLETCLEGEEECDEEFYHSLGMVLRIQRLCVHAKDVK
jgi:hypothetical protein